METTSSTKRAPEYVLHRDVAAMDSADPYTVKAHGMNMTGYERAHIQVVPSEDVEADVEVQWWSDEAEAFIQEHAKITKASVGAGTPFEFTVDCRGRFMFVKVTDLTEVEGAGVKVYVSGFDRRHPE